METTDTPQEENSPNTSIGLSKPESLELPVSHHGLHGAYNIKPNSSINSFTKDIYILTQLSVKGLPIEEDLLSIYKKSSQTSHLLDDNDLEEVYTSSEEIHQEVKSSNQQISTLIELVKLQSNRIDTLIFENTQLRLQLNNNNSILKQIQSNLSSKNQINDTASVSNQNVNTPHVKPQNPNQIAKASYSKAVASGSKRSNETPKQSKSPLHRLLHYNLMMITTKV
ncbi:unnamed protein product, partial [Brachionus calyciflorus]